MPSDDLKKAAFELVAKRSQEFRSALADAVEHLRAFLETQQTTNEGFVGRFRAELGVMGEDRIDVDKFSALFSSSVTLDNAGLEQMEHAYSVLQEMATAGDEQFFAEFEPGESLAAAVEKSLASLGCAFGAARVSELARSGRFKDSIHAEWLTRFPFSRWNAAERRMAPPLVISVPGSAFRPASLTDYIDGGVKLLFLVDAPCPPAALARLVTPSTMVAQAHDLNALKHFADWNGSGVAAVVPKSAAVFTHIPGGGSHVSDRLVVDNVPKIDSVRALEGISAAQQREEIELLLEFTSPQQTSGALPGSKSSGAPPVKSELPDKLAAWLLNRAGLPGAGS